MESETAFIRLRSTFGENRFREDQPTLDSYASSISGNVVLPIGVVFPVSETEVVSLFEIAKIFKLKLYPISRGKNYGYGEAQGTFSGQIIVDLSMMNRIIEVNDKLAYATIQPGVSQEQLFTHLIKSGSRLQLDITGGGLATSLTGNILERGFGHTDYGERFKHIVCMTAVTPEGKIIKTGFGDFPSAKSRFTYRYGTGPVLDGIFSQSNFAIITEMTIELMPRPEKTCMFIVMNHSESDLGELTEAVRELKLSGVVNSAIHIANRSRATGSDSNNLAGNWNMSGSVSGPASLVSVKKKMVRSVIKKHSSKSRIYFFDDFLMGLIRWFHFNIRSVSLYEPLRDAYDLQCGIPTDNPLKILLNNESLETSNLNSADLPVCFSWINAVCPAEKSSVESLYSIIKNEFKNSGYELRITFTSINPRNLILIANTTYRRNPEEIEAALLFSGKIHKRLTDSGFHPYRAGSGSYDNVPEQSADYQQLISKIKLAFDPDGLLAPGKYNIN